LQRRTVSHPQSAGRAVTTTAPLGIGQLRHHDERGPVDPLDHELCDAITAAEPYGSIAVGVDQADLDLPAIAGVNRARSVDDADTEVRGEPGPRVDERRETCRQRDRDPGADEPPLTRLQYEVLGRAQVGSRITRPGIARQVQPGSSCCNSTSTSFTRPA
jgi:hypothetical protein